MDAQAEYQDFKVHPNAWVESPFRDPRFRMFAYLRGAMDESVVTACNAEFDCHYDGFSLNGLHAVKPLALASLLRSVADFIEAHTWPDVEALLDAQRPDTMT